MQERLRFFRLGVMLATAMTFVVSCSPKDDQGEFQKRSEPTQIFFDTRLKSGVPQQRLQRDPGRLIETPLRPSLMRARIPSSYLVYINHPWEPYAKQVWDHAKLGFNLNTLAPAPVTDLIGANKRGRTIEISLGGFSESFRWLAKRPTFEGAKIVSSNSEEVVWKYGTDQKYTLYSHDMVELDGTPIVISCSSICYARLTITPDVTGLPVKEPRDGYGPEGIALAVSFDAKLISQWRDIRAKALCFAAATIVGFNKKEAFEQGPTCVTVQDAIAATLRK